MKAEPILETRAIRRDWLLAVLLAAILSLCWAVNDWPQVGRLNLPDSDDMMRLAQVRDWIAGQGFNDWTQYRVGPPGGSPMHWSRINDLGPAGLIVALTPLLGRHGAEVAAVLGYPATLFAVYLFLSARIARRIGASGSAMVAIVLAALAYPANALFLPGRIDHHGLQIVLILATVLALSRRPSLASGVSAGACVAASLGIGLETAPQLAAVMAALFGRWVWRGEREGPCVAGFGVALGGVTLLLLAFARPTFWPAQWCDTFTPASTTATLVAAVLFAALGAAGERIVDWRWRLVIGGIGGAVSLGNTLAAYPVCLAGPYGPMDAFVRHALIDHIIEAQGLFAAGYAMGVPSAGVMLVASVAAVGLWRARRLRRDHALAQLAVLATSGAVLLCQLRGAYIGSALAAPILAQLVLAAREVPRWRAPAVGAAWLASAGMVWLAVPQRIAAARAEPGTAAFAVRHACKSGDVWQQLDRLPAGTVMAPVDLAAYIVGGTRHRVVGAGYHRNLSGNRALYAFFLSQPARARAIGAAWRTDYVALCPGDFSEIDAAHRYRGSLAAALLDGQPPAWLAPIPLRDAGLQLYRVVP